jgi:hypothetical protein
MVTEMHMVVYGILTGNGDFRVETDLWLNTGTGALRGLALACFYIVGDTHLISYRP